MRRLFGFFLLPAGPLIGVFAASLLIAVVESLLARGVVERHSVACQSGAALPEGSYIKIAMSCDGTKRALYTTSQSIVIAAANSQTPIRVRCSVKKYADDVDCTEK